MFNPLNDIDEILLHSKFIKQKGYWSGKLLPDMPVTGLLSYFKPKTKPKEENNHSATPSFATAEFIIKELLYDKLMKFCKKSDLSLYIVLLTVIKILIYRYTNNDDVTIVSPVYNPNISGETLNDRVFIRDEITDDLVFIRLLLKIRQSVLEAYENQDYPYSKLFEYIFGDSPIRDSGTLSNVLCILKNIHPIVSPAQVDDLIVCEFSHEKDRVVSRFIFNIWSYERQYLEQMTHHFLRVLSQALDQLETPITRLTLSSDKEKQQLIFAYNDTERSYPHDKTIHQLFQEQVEKNPGALAIIDDNQEYTYQWLNQKANHIASILRKKGVGPDTIVAIISDHSPHLIAAVLGVLKAGGAYVPIEPGTPRERLITILDDCSAPIVLILERNLETYSFSALQGVQHLPPRAEITPPRPQIIDLDSLPFPDRSLIDYEKYNRYIGHAMVKHTITLQATRGCPFKCVYCHKIWPKTHMVRSAENLIEEVQLFYNMGIRRFTIIDDIFNFNIENSSRFFRLIIEQGLKVQFFFPNGMRGDILTPDYIDLMVAAGTVSLALALETNSPRLQKLISKNINLERLRQNIEYFCQKHPHVILELNTMLGFPSETKEEALLTLDFLKNVKWIHFPYINILKIYPNTDMAKLAVEYGVSPSDIAASEDLAYHELPDTLPFEKSFALEYQADFLNNYFLSKERLLHVLPHQMKVLTEDEIVQKYNSYLPADINSFADLLDFTGISPQQLSAQPFIHENHMAVPHFNRALREQFPAPQVNNDALRVLLLDLSQFFSNENKILYDVVEPPLGLMYVMTSLKQQYGPKVSGKIAKSRIDFDHYSQLKALLDEFQPHIIGIRNLTFYKDFFHKTVSFIRQWGIHVPIIAGGPYATSGYRTILNDPNVDLVVIGEGEKTFAELIGAILENDSRLPHEDLLKNIPGLAFVPQQEKQATLRTGRDIIVMNLLNPSADNSISNIEHINYPSDLAYVIYTSGSTGKPRGVMIDHRAAVNYIDWAAGQYVQGATLQFPLYTSIAFDLTITSLFVPLLTGNTIRVFSGDENRKEFLIQRIIDENQVGVVKLTPSHLKLIREIITRSTQESSIRRFIVGGEELETQLVSDINRLFHGAVEIYNEYGPTEATVGCMIYQYNPHTDFNQTVPIGTPAGNVQIYLLDSNQSIVPTGVVGELYISGDSLARGYLNRPHLTQELFLPNPFIPGKKMYRTGDLARRLHDGNIEFAGRVDHQIKIRGYRIEPGEIENKLTSHPDIDAAVVIAQSISRFASSEKKPDLSLCTYIVSRREIETNEIKDFLSRNLPEYMVPIFYMRIDHIPLTTNGKIDRKALPLFDIQADVQYTPPQDEIEYHLAAIWSDVLGINREIIGINANFFELGGHSIKATILASRIHKELNIKVPLIEIFKSRTIRQLAQFIKNSVTEKFAAIPAAEKKDYYPISSAQKRLYILHQLELNSTGYNMPHVVHLDDDIDIPQLEHTFKTLIHRHESLRTSFAMIDGQLVQVIHPSVDFSVELVEFSNNQTLKRNEENDEKIIGELRTHFVKPFDLSKAPLLRARLIYTTHSPRKNILLVDMHHIISDGISQEVITRDFLALYNGEKLPGLRLQYKDYSQWLNQPFQQELIARQETFWVDLFAGELPVIDLPSDYPRPSVQEFEGAAVSFGFPTKETFQIYNTLKDHGVTLYMFLLAAFNILLAKLSGQEDIIVGTPIAGRRHTDIESIIGMFVNTLALRNYPTSKKSCREFIKEVKNRTLQAFENQEYQFEDLVDKISIRRDTSRNPIFDVMFNLSNLSNSTQKIHTNKDIDLSQHLEHIKSDVKFDINLRAEESDSVLLFSLSYRTSLFKQQTIDRIITYYKKIISTVCAHPDKLIEAIELISPERKKEILSRFINEIDYDLPFPTLQQQIETRFRENSENIAIEYGTTSISYTQLREKANLIADWIFDNNIRKGTFIGIFLDNKIDIIATIIGILKTACVFVPLDTVLPLNRIETMLQLTHLSIIITDSSNKERLLEHNPELEKETLFLCADSAFYSQFRELPPIEKTIEYNGDDPIYIYFTSGSTGKPKAILGKNRSLLQFLNWEKDTFGIRPGFRVSQFAAVGFDAFLRNVFTPLCAGATVCIPPNRDIIKDRDALIQWINDSCVNLIHCVPSVFRIFNSDWLTPQHYRHLKYILMSGEVIKPSELKKWYQTFSDRIQLVNLYGATETTIIKSYHLINKKDTMSVRIPIGTPMKGSQFILLDEHQNICDQGLVGEIYIRTPFTTFGYYNDLQLTRLRFIPNPFNNDETDLIYKSGDLGRQNTDGIYEFLGRIDRQVKIRGIRIELAELENQLLQHNQIKEAIVLHKKKPDREDFLCAYFIAEKELSTAQLREFLSRYLPEYMIPLYFLQIDRFPLSPNGKIDRNALPEPQLTIGNDYVAPTNELEDILARIWAQVLGIEKNIIGVHSDFFELGGHSLKATILLEQVHQRLNVKIPLVEIFKTPTIKGLATYIASARQETYSNILPVEKKEYYPLSSGQKRIYVMQQMDIQSVAYNMTRVIELEEEPHHQILENVIGQLINRHESLRTAIVTVNGEPVQKIEDNVVFDVEYHHIDPGKIERVINGFVRPYSFETAPLFRISSIQAENRYILMTDMHHIISDGISNDLLLRDFLTFQNGAQPTPLRLQYRDFSEWQNNRSTGATIKKQEEYWLKEFAGDLPILDLPTDYPRPPILRLEGDSTSFKLDEYHTRALYRMVDENKATLFMLLLTLYNILLHKLTGDEEIIIGTPIAGRRHTDLQDIIGMFINTLAFRNFPHPDKTLERFLEEVKENTLQAFDNQDYQFEDLIGNIMVSRDPSRNPLFSAVIIVYNYRDMKNANSNEEETSSRPSVTYNKKTTVNDIVLQCIEGGDNIFCTITFNSSLFKAETIERFIDYFKDIVHAVVENPTLPIGDIQIEHNLGVAQTTTIDMDFNF